MKLTLEKIGEFVSAAGSFPRESVAQGYSIDSRTIQAGELFFAVKGDRFDGHDFVAGVVIETHENTLADTLPSIQRVFEEVQRPNLRLNYQGTEDFFERGYFECLETLYPLVSHMHWQQVPPGGVHDFIEESGIIDFPRLIRVAGPVDFPSARLEFFGKLDKMPL